MHICIISNGYPTSQDPQYGCFEKDQAVALAKLGHKVSMLYVDRRVRPICEIIRKIGINSFSENGITIYRVVMFPFSVSRFISGRLECYFCSIFLNRGLKKLIREGEKPDIIYAHFMYNIAYASYLKRKNNIPLVGMEHWSRLNEIPLSSDVRYLGNIAYCHTDLLISVADSLRNLILKHFGKESVVIHNMIGDEFTNIPIKNIEERSFKFVSTGSLIHRKGFDILINALYEVRDMLPLWKLHVIGDGPERMALQKMIDDYGLSDHIVLLGRKTKKEIVEILSMSDCFVLASRAENFSVAILEGMAAGLPVISSDCGGIRECVNEKNGIIVPVEDVHGLADALVEVSTTKGKYDRNQIKEDCLKNYAPQNVAKRLLKMFDNVCQDKQ